MANENLTLTQAQLATCKPVPGEGGKALRAYCPFHGSDNQRSLRIDAATGHFKCFACGAWGYTEEARERWATDRQAERASNPKPNPPGFKPLAAEREAAPTAARSDLPELLATYQAALPCTWGAKYLEHRKIPLGLAQQYGVGYAAAGTWPGRPWKWGRLVFPHTEPGGEVVNLYGRAVGSNEKVPKKLRHDHLSGTKGIFNARALRMGEGPLFICEGVFDALSLIAAGYPRAVAIFGTNGWRWEWAREVKQIVFAMDADKAGESWRELARQAVLRGKHVAYLSPEAYGGHKDASEAWQAGALRVGAWPILGEPEPESADALIKRQGWALIESTVLGEQVVLAADAEAARQAPAGFAIYTMEEVGRIGDNPAALRAVHRFKRLMGGTVTGVRQEQKEAPQLEPEVLAL
jgi:hypothetical protein